MNITAVYVKKIDTAGDKEYRDISSIPSTGDRGICYFITKGSYGLIVDEI